MERMTEKVIRIEGIDPAELYGVAGSNIDRIGGKFPKLKMVARGSSIKVTGEAGEIERFDRKLSQLIEYYGRYGHVSPQVIDQVYDGGMPTGDGDLPEPQDVIVHGNAGLVVRARTVNQQRLLRLSERNDLLFAVGRRQGHRLICSRGSRFVRCFCGLFGSRSFRRGFFGGRSSFGLGLTLGVGFGGLCGLLGVQLGVLRELHRLHMERVFLVQQLIQRHDGGTGDGHSGGRAQDTEQCFHARTSLKIQFKRTLPHRSAAFRRAPPRWR